SARRSLVVLCLRQALSPCAARAWGEARALAERQRSHRPSSATRAAQTKEYSKVSTTACDHASCATSSGWGEEPSSSLLCLEHPPSSSPWAAGCHASRCGPTVPASRPRDPDENGSLRARESRRCGLRAVDRGRGLAGRGVSGLTSNTIDHADPG